MSSEEAARHARAHALAAAQSAVHAQAQLANAKARAAAAQKVAAAREAAAARAIQRAAHNQAARLQNAGKFKLQMLKSFQTKYPLKIGNDLILMTCLFDHKVYVSNPMRRNNSEPIYSKTSNNLARLE